MWSCREKSATREALKLIRQYAQALPEQTEIRTGHGITNTTELQPAETCTAQKPQSTGSMQTSYSPQQRLKLLSIKLACRGLIFLQLDRSLGQQRTAAVEGSLQEQQNMTAVAQSIMEDTWSRQLPAPAYAPL